MFRLQHVSGQSKFLDSVRAEAEDNVRRVVQNPSEHRDLV